MEKKILFVVLLSFLLIGLSSAQTPVSSCLDLQAITIGDYNLTNDILDDCEFTGNNLLLEGNGFTLQSGGNNLFSASNANNITIRNLIALGNAQEIFEMYAVGDFHLINVFLFGGQGGQINIESDFTDITLENVFSYGDLGNNIFFTSLRYNDTYGDSDITFKNVDVLNQDSGDVVFNIQNSELLNTNMTLTNFKIGSINGNITIYSKEVFLEGENLVLIFGNNIFLENNNFTILSDVDNANLMFNNTLTHIKMTGLSFIIPKVLRDGIDCPVDVCTNLVYAGGTADFDVTGWSSYSLEETFVATPTEQNLIQGSGTIYESMKSSGAGLGKFLQYMALSIPFLVIGLAVVGIVITIAFGVSFILKGFMIKR